MAEQITEYIQAQLLYGVGGWYARNKMSRKQPNNSATEKEVRSVHFMSRKKLRQARSRDGPQNNCQKRPELNNAVSPGQCFFGKQFRQQSILRWPKDCRLRAGQEDCYEQKRN